MEKMFSLLLLDIKNSSWKHLIQLDKTVDKTETINSKWGSKLFTF